MGRGSPYGLGSANDNLPTFVVLVAKPSNTEQVQAISARLWQAGYLPGEHSGVSFRSGGDPILYINNPDGVPPDVRRRTLDGLKALNELTYQQVGDPETHTRIQQYELAFRMQSSVPDLTDLLEGALRVDPEKALRRRHREAGGRSLTPPCSPVGWSSEEVRFVQIYHTTIGTTTATWPAGCPRPMQGRRPALLGLIQDLKQRGLFDETLW